MDFGSAYLFTKKPEDRRRVGGLGGRARARNLRLWKARQEPVTRDLSIAQAQPTREETAAEAIRRIDALCPWLVGVQGRPRRGLKTRQPRKTPVSRRLRPRLRARPYAPQRPLLPAAAAKLRNPGQVHKRSGKL